MRYSEARSALFRDVVDGITLDLRWVFTGAELYGLVGLTRRGVSNT